MQPLTSSATNIVRSPNTLLTPSKEDTNQAQSADNQHATDTPSKENQLQTTDLSHGESYKPRPVRKRKRMEFPGSGKLKLA